MTPGSKETVHFVLPKKEIDFAIGAGGWIIDVDISLDWIGEESVVERAPTEETTTENLDAVEQAKKGVTTLEELFVKHDVILLPMDCQELCWPSTVLGATKGKIVPNVALGFDTFIVMRHGAWIPNTKGNRLRCYYYNDIIAPTYVSFRGNVLTDDRQLTSCGNPSRIGHSTRCRDMRVKTRPLTLSA